MIPHPHLRRQGGSSLWFNPAENIGFGYACTGFAAGINGDANRLEPINAALRDSPAFTYTGPPLRSKM